MNLAFDAADAEIIRVEQLTVPPEAWAGLQFKVHPSLHRIQYFWNVIPLWQSLVHDQDLPELVCSSEVISWVVWRSQEYMTQFYSLAHEEAWALDGIIQGLSFGELCAGLCEFFAPEDVGMKAASYLKGWIEKGMLAQMLIAS